MSDHWAWLRRRRLRPSHPRATDAKDEAAARDRTTEKHDGDKVSLTLINFRHHPDYRAKKPTSELIARLGSNDVTHFRSATGRRVNAHYCLALLGWIADLDIVRAGACAHEHLFAAVDAAFHDPMQIVAGRLWSRGLLSAAVHRPTFGSLRAVVTTVGTQGREFRRRGACGRQPHRGDGR